MAAELTGFGSDLRRERLAAGLTQEELATLDQAVKVLEGVLRDWPSEG